MSEDEEEGGDEMPPCLEEGSSGVGMDQNMLKEEKYEVRLTVHGRTSSGRADIWYG